MVLLLFAIHIESDLAGEYKLQWVGNGDTVWHSFNMHAVMMEDGWIDVVVGTEERQTRVLLANHIMYGRITTMQSFWGFFVPLCNNFHNIIHPHCGLG